MHLEKQDIELIKKAFPDEAIQVKKALRDPKGGQTFKVLVGFKPQYVIERLNECFGHGGWDFEVIKLEMNDNCAWCLGRLTTYIKAPVEGITNTLRESKFTVKEQIGSCEYDKGRISYGDALKGAVTNCLEKCASLLDIGHEAYKGLLGPTEAALLLAGISDADLAVNSTASALEPLKAELKTLCTQYKIGKEEFIAMTSTVFGSKKEPKDLTADEYKKLIAHVKKHEGPF